MAKKKVVINELLMSDRVVVMQRDPFNRVGGGSVMNEETKAFFHENEKEGGQGIPLLYTSSRCKLGCRSSVDQDGESGRLNQG